MMNDLTIEQIEANWSEERKRAQTFTEQGWQIEKDANRRRDDLFRELIKQHCARIGKAGAGEEYAVLNIALWRAFDAVDRFEKVWPDLSVGNIRGGLENASKALDFLINYHAHNLDKLGSK